MSLTTLLAAGLLAAAAAPTAADIENYRTAHEALLIELGVSARLAGYCAAYDPDGRTAAHFLGSPYINASSPASHSLMLAMRGHYADGAAQGRREKPRAESCQRLIDQAQTKLRRAQSEFEALQRGWDRLGYTWPEP